MNLDELAQPGRPLRIFGNLPYNIFNPLIFHLLEKSQYITDMYFMLQKEAVERLAAGPNSKDYGRLTVMTQYYCQVMPVLEVGPHAFKPAPKVNSAVVRLAPWKKRPYEALNIADLQRLSGSVLVNVVRLSVTPSVVSLLPSSWRRLILIQTCDQKT